MKIKICGLTSPKEAIMLNPYHVDFAGMVLFFPKSKRNISPEQAQNIICALDKDIKKVAVVVSPGHEEICQIEELGFDYIQIHGTLDEKLLVQIHLPVLKAFNVSDLSEYTRYLDYPQIAGYVFDALEPGSGKTFDWRLVPELPKSNKLLLLAGGLHPGNVAQAIAAVHPDGVDISSGVEYDDRPGKDFAKVDAFVTAVRAAIR
ncbi:MAG: phosphoribosylanthranilate isomerase [Eubacteriales bacterium]|nr:phosphoribosylanthranilate isomerase [Eubacteriales bacterium]